VPGELIIHLKQGFTEQSLGAVDVFARIPQIDVVAIRVPDEMTAFEAYRRHPAVRQAELNLVGQLALVPNDPRLSQQWAITKIEAQSAWDVTTGSSSVKIAIVDTGIDYSHEDLSSKYVAGGYDWVNNDSNPMDDNGHGTAVAGIAAAATNNAKGIAGLCWNCKLIAEKAATSDEPHTFSSTSRRSFTPPTSELG
jgi:thermitase